MESVKVRTTQNVYIDYPIASLGERIGAYLIDGLVILVYFIIVASSLAVAQVNSVWIFVVFFLPVIFYHLISEIFMNGQSIGKNALQIRVVKLDGTPPTLGSYLLRWILRPIDISLFYGGVAILTILAGGKGQRLGDIAAGTTVVKLKKRVAVNSHQLIQEVDDSYDPVFPQVVNLTDRQVEIIREALEVNKKTANNEPVLAITEKTKKILDIRSDLPPVKFLHTVVKDYHHITSKA